MKKKFGDYYLGLDIGTDSIGWAVTDLNYKLQKLNGKALWGIRLFEGGKTAAERRIHRTARRRQQRKIQRIQLLQEIFAEEICKVDPGFFLRLKESKFYQEDKTVNQPYAFFNDVGFNDKDYHRKYPTIYHLRKALIDNEEEFDVRLVYLAVHHIIKSRGHFLFEGQNMESITSFPKVFNDLKVHLYDEFQIDFECENLDRVEEILKSKEIGIRDKKKQLGKLLDGDTKQKIAMIGLILGSPAKLSELFNDQSLNEAEINKVCFNNEDYETNKDQLAALLDDRMFYLEKLKAIYDWSVLANIRQGEKYLSYTKTAVYEKHKKDLKLLKKVVKTYRSEKYHEVFSDPAVKNNYCAYVGLCKKNNKKIAVNKKCVQQDEVCKYLEGLLKNIDTEDPEYLYIMKELENKTLLPKQTSKDNGVIPYQMHREELEVILNNASRYLNFLNEVDETGLSAKEKIIKILTFRIPYYVGPLNDAHKDKGKSNCWIIKRAQEKILPWNFEEVVDLEASAEGFIRRMTNKCTYLFGADVIPKNSLLYSEYMVLNELNNLKINGEGISVDLKQKIYADLFMKYTKVTMKRLRDYLEAEGVIGKQDEISGIDGDFKTSLTSYLDFKRRIGDKVSNVTMVEDIICWIVLFGDDTYLLKGRIKKHYGDELSDKEINNLTSLKYSGWGRFSKEFLEDIVHKDKGTGVCLNIISALRNTNNNLMQLLSGRFDYLDEVEKYNASQTGTPSEITYEMVEDLYVSPAVKRSIWQTLLIVKEIAKVMQSQPKKVFVEMTRADAQKKPTKSRKDKLVELYNACKTEERNWSEEIAGKTDGDLRSDRLYLYYTQMGRCMYTGESINLENLFDQNIYDVDHIFPRSRIKDDSLENRVLVKRTINHDKSDRYPLSREIQEKNRDFWKSLYNKNFIGQKKYDRLTRTIPFSQDELADFIARQVVETSQSTKAVADILKKTFDTSEIVYVKAGNVSDFRQWADLIKVRDINDYHHAKDAYLNIVVGNVYNTKFTHSPINFIKEYHGKQYNLNRMYDFDVARNGLTAWKAGENGTIIDVKKVMAKNNILFTRYATESKGALFDQMIVRKGTGQLPIKSSDPRLSDIGKYGGYNKVAGAYFMLAEHDHKKKKVRTIEYVPVHLAKQLEGDNEAKLRYSLENLKLKNARILLSKIKINTLFDIDGFKMHLSGRTGDRLIFKGANQLCIGRDDELYLKNVLKYLNRSKEAKRELPITVFDGISEEENNRIYEVYQQKLQNTVYNVRLSAQVEKFEKGREKFGGSSFGQQCKLLAEALYLFQCNSVSADLSLIGGAKNAGIIVLPKDISKNKQAKIINQSPTGIFTQEVDLLKL
ncbi:type II CRISPR RNA-guided endonuclease Cas9 [Dehalobacterium formicoaceticum]|uniref:CRISPR-associated endonuclease Cas9 n=1 Tax=Dehalobacterium formicoaceticum TaxID=51515 RepID=A0ABT1Y778_9FIRM|nr:type II CRISPR RNA-guided endonuclease Cas9 [Dehalobacterium formicoaceticum]MCR6546737.1 type II CRISPR RNA-guided endonuclease Cas9 [Dehalobacterium formicoaceticum]